MKKPAKRALGKKKLDPYGTHLTVVFANDIVEAARECGIDDAESVDDAAGFVAACGHDIYLVMRVQNLTYGTVVHEAQHVVFKVFRHIEQDLEGSEEPACYLLEHVVEYVLKLAKSKRIPIRIL